MPSARPFMHSHRQSSSSLVTSLVRTSSDSHHDRSSSDVTPRSSCNGLIRDSNNASKKSSHESTRTTLIEEEGTSVSTAKAALKDDKPIKWKELPHKDQLAILTLARLAEPLAQTSLTAYMFFMLKSFDPTLSDSSVSGQAGLLAGAFTAAQCLTAVIWGRVADTEWAGRKNVLVISTIGTMISTIGFGFSRSFAQAMFFRVLGGALNSTVGIMRTMISEIIMERKYQAKAFLIMPVTFNVGILIGPLIGGWLQDPIHTFPKLFGSNSRFGGKNGVNWMTKFPYALPNLLIGGLFVLTIIVLILGLKETHIDRRHRPDWGIIIRKRFTHAICWPFRSKSDHQYAKVESDETNDLELLSTQRHFSTDLPVPKRPKLPYRRIFTKNVLCTFFAHGMIATQMSSFNGLWFLFLSTPRFDPAHPNPASHHAQHPPFNFTGGLGLPPPTIGMAVGILGVLGLCLQFGVYSRITHRLGLVRTYRYGLLLPPLSYTLAPFLVLLPTRSISPSPSDGPWMWLGISTVLFVQVIARTFVLPITQILINNCTPHPSVLSSIHGVGQSVSAGGRFVGPVVFSFIYGYGLRKGVVGMAWWSLTIEAVLTLFASLLLREGTGHEIRLEDDP